MICMNDAMMTGIPHVDNQHRTLIDAINQFTEACAQGKGRKQIEETLDFVVSYTREHFRDEERIQERFSFPGVALHRWLHTQFSIKITALVQEFRQTGPTVVLVGELNKALADWFINHIKTEDKKIGEYIKKAS